MRIENGTALAEKLEPVANKEDIYEYSQPFEAIRKPRAELIANASAMLGKDVAAAGWRGPTAT